MITIISDQERTQLSRKVKDILRHLHIKDWKYEAYFTHQNLSERRYQDVKRYCQQILKSSGAPDNCWFLSMEYICYVLNIMVLKSLDWCTPYEILYGITPDISLIICHKFWDKVYYQNLDKHFPSSSNESLGYFVGFSESCGNPITFKIISDTGRKIIFRSCIRSHDYTTPNRRIYHPYSSNDILLDSPKNITFSDQDNYGVIDINDLYSSSEDKFYDHCQGLRKCMSSSVDGRIYQLDKDPVLRNLDVTTLIRYVII